jgi:hypothetical protein
MSSNSIHYSIMVVDIESFGRRLNPAQAALRAAMYRVVRAAAGDAQLSWDEFVALDRGDAILMLVPPNISPVVLAGTFLRALDINLSEWARTAGPERTMRFRVAMHHGLVSEDEHGWVGEAINTTTRLVDAQPLREALKAATWAHLAFIVSDEIYRGVIRHEYRTIDASTFQPVHLTAKELEDTVAWVHVPQYPADRADPSRVPDPAR